MTTRLQIIREPIIEDKATPELNAITTMFLQRDGINHVINSNLEFSQKALF